MEKYEQAMTEWKASLEGVAMLEIREEQSFKPRDQVAYIPDHAEGDMSHPDVEYGFVTSVKGNTVFCRYWSNRDPRELRTKANSEGTPVGNLVRYVSRSQGEVDEAYENLCQ